MARREGMQMVGPLIEAKKRIAELEAELAVERGARDDFKRGWEGEKAWREKAEAEVERLQRRIAELERLLTLSSSPLTHQGEPGVNPSGELSLSARKATPKTRLFNQATNQWEEVG